MSIQVNCRRCGTPFEAKRIIAMWCAACKIVRNQEKTQRYELHKKQPCPSCGKSMVRGAGLCRSCDNKARTIRYLGENNPNWRQGRTISHGYVRVRVSATAKGTQAYRLEHHIVWEEAHGQSLPKGWLIHHLNGIKHDNRPENLAAMSRSQHHTHHAKFYEERIRELEEQLRHRRGMEPLVIAVGNGQLGAIEN